MTIAMERATLTAKAEKAANEIKRFADLYGERKAAGKPEAERFTAEERSAYDGANAEFDSATARLAELDREASVEERAGVIAAFRQERDNAVRRERESGERRQIPGRDEGNLGTSRDRDLSPEDKEELRSLAFLGAMRRNLGDRPTHRQAEAAKRLGVKLDERSLTVRLLTGDAYEEFRKTGECRAITKTTGASLLAPASLVANVETAMLAFGPMLQVSEIIRTDDGNDLKLPTENDTASVGEIVGEGSSVETDEDPTLSELVLGAFKFSSKRILVTPEQLQDSAFDIIGRIGRMTGERWGRRQNVAYTTGAGTTTGPLGIVPAATLGKTAAGAAAITGDEILDLIASVDPAYQADPSFGVMANPSTLLLLRKLKDSQGQYLWGMGLNGVRSQTIAGVPAIANPQMAAATTGNKSVLAGAFRKYVVRQVANPRYRRLIELYAGTDREGFISFLRADGDLLDAGTHPVKYLVQA